MLQVYISFTCNTVYSQDILEFVGWELIGVLVQQEDFHATNDYYSDLLEAIAEVFYRIIKTLVIAAQFF